MYKIKANCKAFGLNSNFSFYIMFFLTKSLLSICERMFGKQIFLLLRIVPSQITHYPVTASFVVWRTTRVGAVLPVVFEGESGERVIVLLLV